MKEELKSMKTVSIGGNVSHSIVANVINFPKKSSPRMNYPPDSIGAKIQNKNYLDYLIKQYYDFRKADAIFGVTQIANNFSYAVIHKSIQSKFKAKTFFVPEKKFMEVCIYVKSKIDGTILGKRNKNLGRRNYISFDEYLH